MNRYVILLQVVERLEADLGVKVQEVRFPELRYGFQIWDTYMGLPDKEGKVRPSDKLDPCACACPLQRCHWAADHLWLCCFGSRKTRGKQAVVAVLFQDPESINF